MSDPVIIDWRTADFLVQPSDTVENGIPSFEQL